ncbi:MAG: hypothetical protein HOO02_04350 [Rhodospirillaceae bacterium]|nr:hypothetical protein [Rhodospirillaceae bacterium]
MDIMQPFMDSTDIINDGAALAERMDKDGYLFIRGLVPAEAAGNVGAQFLEIAGDGGWLALINQRAGVLPIWRQPVPIRSRNFWMYFRNFIAAKIPMH